MNFVYEYRTSDNARHSGVVKAASRDAAFAALKRQGVHPSRLSEAPGFFNKLFGRGKRWLAIAALAIALVAAFAVKVGADRRAARLERDAQFTTDVFDSQTRRQILGDAAIIEKGIRTGWADVFAAEGDRFFASFAIPGVLPAVRNATESELRRVLFPDQNDTLASGRDRALHEAPGTKHKAQGTSLEFRQIRAMVEGVKNEAREFLRAGGTLQAYGKKLVARQEAEIAIYNRAKSELQTMAKDGMSGAELEELWEKRNDELRTMGIRLVPMPERQ